MTEEKIDPRLWGWTSISKVEAHGPFDTKEAAIKDAEEYFTDREVVSIYVGNIKFLDPSEHISAEMSLILDNMHSDVWDSYDIDDEVFHVPPEQEEEAEKELDEFLEYWAKKYVQNIDGYWILIDENKVDIILKPKEGGAP